MELSIRKGCQDLYLPQYCLVRVAIIPILKHAIKFFCTGNTTKVLTFFYYTLNTNKSNMAVIPRYLVKMN